VRRGIKDHSSKGDLLGSEKKAVRLSEETENRLDPWYSLYIFAWKE